MAKHCFHPTGQIYTSFPGQWDEICCWCGRSIRVGQELGPPSGHGPLARLEIINETRSPEIDDEECPARHD